MKLIKKHIETDGSGFVTLRPEEAEDLWHLYHLVARGDRVKATAIRKIQKESSTGSTSAERVKLNLTIGVEKIDFDPVAGKLRLAGKNKEESPFVKLDQYHTLEIEVNRNITIGKLRWDSIYLKRVEDACDVTKTADVAAVVLQEGLAHICLITSNMTVDRQKIETNIPRKRPGASGHDKALNTFFENILQAILRHVDFDIVKCLILASPGFTKNQLYEYIMQQAQAKDIKVILANKSKIILCHTSSGHKHALKEALSDPSVAKNLEDTKAAGEVKALGQFFDMLNTQPERAFYGPKHVFKANEAMAIQTLLITDELFRSSKVTERQKYVDLVESVRANSGDVKIFSSMHVSGEQLAQLSGICAILRFPLPDLAEEDESDEESENESENSSDEEEEEEDEEEEEESDNDDDNNNNNEANDSDGELDDYDDED